MLHKMNTMVAGGDLVELIQSSEEQKVFKDGNTTIMVVNDSVVYNQQEIDEMLKQVAELYIKKLRK